MADNLSRHTFTDAESETLVDEEYKINALVPFCEWSEKNTSSL